MAKQWRAPGTCADCGNDAFIRMGARDDQMLCAHCYAEHMRSGKAGGESAPRKPTPTPRLQ